jgi:c-di-GMP phosphodiesterase
MRYFQEFLNDIYKFTRLTFNSGSILQITVKNYDQLGCMCKPEELDKIFRTSVDIIETSFSNIKSKLFEYNKFIYVVLDIDDKAKIQEISRKIHLNLIEGLINQYFVDARIVGCKFNNNSNLTDIINLLCDEIHYSDESTIFSWIENPEIYLNKLKLDYTKLTDLRDRITNKTACFAFQPIIECKTGDISYHECLLRLSDNDFHLISAGSYIQLAEKYGLITVVDKYVVEMAISELEQTENDISLSVNISNIGISDDYLNNYIKSLLSNSNVGDRLIVEITETSMNKDFNKTLKFVEMLKSFGCRIALDDFGSGYSSFEQFRKFPIDILKIDGSYIRDIDTNPKNMFLVENLIKTAEEIGCKTVAEFVESGSIAKKLIELKVDYMQGNFFSPAQNYRSWEKS